MVDLNADLGESFGVYRYGADDELLPLITSANVACGFHASDPVTMAASVDAALAAGVRIGAHIGLPDRLGFGRRHMAITAEDAHAYTLYQLGALDAFVRGRGAHLSHVKPHGALYMSACEDPRIAGPIAEAVARHDQTLAVYALPGSALELAAASHDLQVYPEFFADRPYVDDVVQMFGWTYEQIGGPRDAADRVTRMLRSSAHDSVRTVCVHSDTRGAAGITAAVRDALDRAGALPTSPHPTPTAPR